MHVSKIKLSKKTKETIQLILAIVLIVSMFVLLFAIALPYENFNTETTKVGLPVPEYLKNNISYASHDTVIYYTNGAINSHKIYAKNDTIYKITKY